MKCIQTTNTLDVYGELVFQGSIVSMSFLCFFSFFMPGGRYVKQVLT